jgi:hypothetical protein
MVFEILHARYEAPAWYAEPRLSELEDALEEALRALAGQQREAITLVPRNAGLDVAAWKRALDRVPLAPAAVIFDSAKFSRLMKGRLWFYAHAPEHFDTDWLIQNDVGRMGNNFYRVPFRVFWRQLSGQTVEDPTPILEKLRGRPLTSADVAAVREFDRLTSAPAPASRQTALALVAVFDDFFAALSRISAASTSAAIAPPP